MCVCLEIIKEATPFIICGMFYAVWAGLQEGGRVIFPGPDLVRGPKAGAQLPYEKIYYIFVHGENDSCYRYVQYICIRKTIKITLIIVRRLPRVCLTIFRTWYL